MIRIFLPGAADGHQNGGAAPDYLLYSGMYRDVHLMFKDSVYIPCGDSGSPRPERQRSPTVHAVTSIRNETAAAKSVTVGLTLLNIVRCERGDPDGDSNGQRGQRRTIST